MVVIQILLRLALYLAILVCDSRAWLHVVPRQPGCIFFVLSLSASWMHGRLTLTGQSQLHNIRKTLCHYHLFFSYTYRDAVWVKAVSHSMRHPPCRNFAISLYSSLVLLCKYRNSVLKYLWGFWEACCCFCLLLSSQMINMSRLESDTFSILWLDICVVTILTNLWAGLLLIANDGIVLLFFLEYSSLLILNRSWSNFN